MTGNANVDSHMPESRSLGDECTLSPDQQIARLAMIRREFHSELRGQQLLPNGLSSDPDTFVLRG